MVASLNKSWTEQNRLSPINIHNQTQMAYITFCDIYQVTRFAIKCYKIKNQS